MRRAAFKATVINAFGAVRSSSIYPSVLRRTIGILSFTPRKSEYEAFANQMQQTISRTGVNEARVTYIAHVPDSTRQVFTHYKGNAARVPHWTLSTSSPNLEEARAAKLEELDGYCKSGIRTVFMPNGNVRTADEKHLRHKESSRTPLTLLWKPEEIFPLIRRKYPDLTISVAGYPEGHVETQKKYPDKDSAMQHDVRNLVKKIKPLGDHYQITTQHSYNEVMVDKYIRACKDAGIDPQKMRFTFYPFHLLDKNMAQTMAKAGGVGLPPRVTAIYDAARNLQVENPEAYEASQFDAWQKNELLEISIKHFNAITNVLQKHGIPKDNMIIYTNNEQEQSVRFFKAAGLMPFEHILTNTENSTHTITLNRPEVGNAFNTTMANEMWQAFEAARSNPDIKQVDIRANGEVFCGGGDLPFMKSLTKHEKALAFTEALCGMFQTMHELTREKPVIVIVQGASVGVGVGLMAGASRTLISENAKAAVRTSKIGVLPATIAPNIVAAIGSENAAKLFTSGEFITSQKAVEIGLAHAVISSSKAASVEFRDHQSVRNVGSIGLPDIVAGEDVQSLIKLAVGMPNLADSQRKIQYNALANLLASCIITPKAQELIFKKYMDLKKVASENSVVQPGSSVTQVYHPAKEHQFDIGNSVVLQLRNPNHSVILNVGNNSEHYSNVEQAVQTHLNLPYQSGVTLITSDSAAAENIHVIAAHKVISDILDKRGMEYGRNFTSSINITVTSKEIKDKTMSGRENVQAALIR